jgi:hypothetical protein
MRASVVLVLVLLLLLVLLFDVTSVSCIRTLL